MKKQLMTLLALSALCLTGFAAEAKLPADLPEALQKIPAEKIHLLAGNLLMSNKTVKDAESPTGSAATLVNGAKANTKGLHGGIYSPTDKKYPLANTVPYQPDEKYHWYYLGRCQSVVGPKSRIFIADWTIWFDLSNFAGKKYDCWISAKVQGAPIVPNSAKPANLYVDRAILVEL